MLHGNQAGLHLLPCARISTTSRSTTSSTRWLLTTRTNSHTSHSPTCIVGIPPTTVFLQHQHSDTILPLRPIHHQQVAIQRTMEGLFKVLKCTQRFRVDWLLQTISQSWQPIRLLYQTTHGILIRFHHIISPDEKTLTQIRLRSIPWLSQCPSRTCCH